MKEIIGIVAATKDGVIALNQSLPWCYEKEIEFFRNTTRGHTVIMGRKTYDALPKKFLRERVGVVFSHNRQLTLPDAVVCYDEEAFQKYMDSYIGSSPLFMIGGGEIAKVFFKNNWMSSFLLTEIHSPYCGDTYIDLRALRGWERELKQRTENYTIYLLTNPNRRDV